MPDLGSPMIELRGVTTSRGMFPVLSGFTLSVNQGQFLNLYGPTGCGKTTVLRAAAGLLRPAAGTVLIAGQDLSRLSSGDLRRLRLHFGFLSLELLPPEDETLAEGVALPAILAGFSNAEAKSLALEALSLCELEPLAGEKVGKLSSGERQLACLAMALVHQPMLVFADEPVAGLDPEKAALVTGVLSQYAAQGGTVLSVSHSPLSADAVISVGMEKLHHG